MICPHCRQAFHDDRREILLGIDKDWGWALYKQKCPECNRFILELMSGEPARRPHSKLPVESAAAVPAPDNLVGILDTPKAKVSLVYPKGSSRPACPTEVPAKYAEDYNEACLVLTDSPKASAALSRRCLQLLLRDEANVKPNDLYKEIEELINRQTLPSHLAENLHAVRTIGNFAAHPIKSANTGDIQPVEPDEAEWNLATLEGLFDFYFVAPAADRKRKAALNAKLVNAGKSPIN